MMPAKICANTSLSASLEVEIEQRHGRRAGRRRGSAIAQAVHDWKKTAEAGEAVSNCSSMSGFTIGLPAGQPVVSGFRPANANRVAALWIYGGCGRRC
jgi:hypothetical protein